MLPNAGARDSSLRFAPFRMTGWRTVLAFRRGHPLRSLRSAVPPYAARRGRGLPLAPS